MLTTGARLAVILLFLSVCLLAAICFTCFPAEAGYLRARMTRVGVGLLCCCQARRCFMTLIVVPMLLPLLLLSMVCLICSCSCHGIFYTGAFLDLSGRAACSARPPARTQQGFVPHPSRLFCVSYISTMPLCAIRVPCRDTILKVDQAHMMPETIQSLTVTDKKVRDVFRLARFMSGWVGGVQTTVLHCGVVAVSSAPFVFCAQSLMWS